MVLPLYWKRWLVPAAAALAIVVYIALAEIDRMVAQYPSSVGRTSSFSAVFGPGALGGKDAWSIWADTLIQFPRVGQLLLVHSTLDIVFYAAYFVVGFYLLRFRPAHRRWLYAVIATEVVESFLLCAGALAILDGKAPDHAGVIAVVATVKWIAIIGLVIAVARVRQTWSRLRLVGSALYAQRISLVAVVGIGAVSLIPQGNVSDQLPDIQREWLAQPDPDFLHPVVATALVGLVALSSFFIGRKRSQIRRRILVTGPDEPPEATGINYVFWFAIPALAFLGGIAVLGAGRTDLIDVPAWLIFLGITLGIPGLSLAIDGVLALWMWLGTRLPARLRPPAASATASVVGTPGHVARYIATLRAGDILAGAVFAIAGAALVRSFTVVAVLDNAQSWVIGLPLVLSVVGILVACVSVPLVLALGRRIDATGPTPGLVGELRAEVAGGAQTPSPAVSVVSLVIVGVGSSLVIVLALAIPRPLSEFLGPVGITLALIGSWTGLVGVISVVLRRRKPLSLFRRVLRLRSDPVVTLILVIPLVLSALNGSAGLHAVRVTTATAPDRDTLSQAFEHWLERGDSCELPTAPDPESVGVRPLVLVAAEGGGIRAAAWTVETLTQLSGVACASESVFLSSGVSGGSVGLALLHTTGDATQALEGADELGDPTTLAAAVAGLLTSDPIASAFGVRLPSDGISSGRWADRAAAIEAAWRTSAPDLSDPMDAQVAGPTGLLVLNSVDVRTQCRVIVSQIDLEFTRTGEENGSPRDQDGIGDDGAPDCQSGNPDSPMTLDLLDYLRTCDAGLDWATAAMLSARFPIVTPAGRVTPQTTGCADMPDLQLVDGGYGEGSGLSFLADFAPALTGEIQRHNAAVAGGVAEGPGSNAYVVPIIVYLQNSTGAYTTSPTPPATPEFIVPIAGLNTRSQFIAAETFIQRIESTLSTACAGALDPAPCLRATTTVVDAIGGATVVVAPATRPAITAPLGWTLSAYSVSELTTQAGLRAASCDGIPESEAGCFAQLLGLLGGTIEVEGPPQD